MTQLQLSLLIDTDEIQDFSKEENFVSSEDTILSFTCEDITVVMATFKSQPMKFIKVICLIATILRIQIKATYFRPKFECA